MGKSLYLEIIYSNSQIPTFTIQGILKAKTPTSNQDGIMARLTLLHEQHHEQ